MLRHHRPVWRHTGWLVLAAALLPCLAGAPGAAAETVSIPLRPGTAEIGFRAWAFGLMPYDGIFTRFSGELMVDRAIAGVCHVRVSVDLTSLRMPTPYSQAVALAPGMLDPARFPTMSYIGTCQGTGLGGDLTLHGVTRPLELNLRRTPDRTIAEADLPRAAWGMDERSFTIGPTIRIRISAALPP